MNKQQRSRLKLLGILSAFAGPLLIATVLYFGQDWFEFDSTAKGHLISEEQTITSADYHLVNADEGFAVSNTPLLDGRWLLLFNGSATCDLYCQANLFKMRQTRLVLGRDFKRVRTIYLLSENAPSPELKRVLKQYPNFSLYQAGDAIKPSKQASTLRQGQVYIVDPKGNLIIQYPPDAYSRDIIKDFKRLLKVSKIG